MNNDIRMIPIVLDLEGSPLLEIPEDENNSLFEKEVLSLLGEPELCSPMRDCFADERKNITPEKDVQRRTCLCFCHNVEKETNGETERTFVSRRVTFEALYEPKVTTPRLSNAEEEQNNSVFVIKSKESRGKKRKREKVNETATTETESEFSRISKRDSSFDTKQRKPKLRLRFLKVYAAMKARLEKKYGMKGF